VERIAPEDANLVAALRWGSETGDAEHQLRLLDAIWRYWWVRGELAQGRGWIDDALRHEDADPTLRVRALKGAAGLAWAAGDYERAVELAEEARALVREGADESELLGCLTILGDLALERRELEYAATLFEEALTLAEAPDREAGIHATRALGHLNLAAVRLTAGDLDRAAAGYRTAIDLYSADDDRYGVALARLYLGFVELEGGGHDEAARDFGSALDVFAEMDFPQYASQCLDGIAEIVHARRSAEEAVAVLAAASTLRERLGSSGSIISGQVHDRVATAALSELGGAGFGAAWSRGSALSEGEALEYARHALAAASL
jgi:tetratricopeptide (TPR) repeat protein